MQQKLRFIVVLALSVAGALPAAADYLGGVVFSRPTPAYLSYDQWVDIAIDYKVTEPSGGLIFARPYTNGAPTPGYGATGGYTTSGVTGTATQAFHILSGEQVVDQVRITLVSPDQSQTWLELFLPVYFHYGPNAIYDITPATTRHSALRWGQNFGVTFSYRASDAAGCYAYARPYTHGAPTPGYVASGSPFLPQAGTTSQTFRFLGDADVTHVRYYLLDHTGTQLLWECFVPYDLHWRQVGIYNITFDRPYESSLVHAQPATASFTIDHTLPTDTHVWAWCTTDGAMTPGMACQPSPSEAAGAHPTSRWSRVTSGEQRVNGFQFRVESGDVTVDINVPVDYAYAAHAMQNPVFLPASPAILSNGEYLGVTFDYITAAAGSVRLFARPALAGELVLGNLTYTSTQVPAPSGSATCWCTFATDDRVADSLRLAMYSGDWTQQLLLHFYHGHFAWGGTAVITPVDAAPFAVAAELGRIFPNPFNPVATVPVTLATDAAVRVAVFDLRGRLVRTLHDGPLPAGRHDLRFDGAALASGTYVCRLDGPSGAQTRRLTLVK